MATNVEIGSRQLLRFVVTFTWTLVLSSLLCGTAAADLTRIVVDAHLANDGRFVVVETHYRKIGEGYESDFRSFGLGVDQTIVLNGITRISADGTETPLVDQGLVDREADGPDQFRYYPRGHVYYRYPVVTEDTELRYRFEYELVNAVSPAWGLGAGWDPLSLEYGFGSPMRRIKAIVEDAKEAWPAPDRRYRLDHSVLLPERNPNQETAFELNYTIRFDTAWREVDPDAELARVTPAIEYRVRRLFEYLPAGQPSATNSPQSKARYGAVLVVLVLGPLVFLLYLVFEALTGGKRWDTQEVAERLSSLTPEEIQAQLQKPTPHFSLEDLLDRLEGERKLAIDAVLNDKNKETGELRIQLLVPRASLPALESDFINMIFGEDDTVTTSRQIRERSRESEQRPDWYWNRLIAEKEPTGDKSNFPLIALPVVAVGLWGSYQQVIGLQRDDDFVVVLIVNFFALCCTFGWPKRWWNGRLPRRGLFLNFVVLVMLYGTLFLAVNRPYPVEAWIGAAVSILAFFSAQMIGSRMPHRGVWKLRRELYRVRQYAITELRKPAPALDDRWNSHLVALGLGPQIERYRNESGGQPMKAALVADRRDKLPDTSRSPTSARFKGILPRPSIREPGWANVFLLTLDELYDEGDEDSVASF